MKVMISCGEPSGDLYAGALAREIHACDASVRVFGLGGEHLRAAGGEVVGDYGGLAVTGLSEALAVLPKSYSTYRRLVRLARHERPNVFVPVDFPDFNFRLAGTLRRMGIPVVYYICPQVWAWRQRRIRTIKRFVERALVIFPFEEAIYRAAGIPVDFVGHPLVELARAVRPRAEVLRAASLKPEAPTVALLPGSRPNEVRAILPDLVKAAALIARQVPTVQFFIARAPQLDDQLFEPVAALSAIAGRAAVVKAQTDDVLAASDVVVTASGTATVQAAIHGRPMVIVYRLSPLTYQLVKTFARVDDVGMVNLIAGERVVPELIQNDFTPDAVAEEIIGFICDPARASVVKAALRRVVSKLGGPGASRRAAEAILAVASGAATVKR